jgi:hypothetical protein
MHLFKLTAMIIDASAIWQEDERLLDNTVAEVELVDQCFHETTCFMGMVGVVSSSSVRLIGGTSREHWAVGLDVRHTAQIGLESLKNMRYNLIFMNNITRSVSNAQTAMQTRESPSCESTTRASCRSPAAATM